MGESIRKLIFILGPTGTGKSKLALEMAPHLGGTILNADSVQFYAGVKIGANKPSAEEMAICPHALFDMVPVGHEATAGDYARAVENYLKSHGQAQSIFVVGGSGFYVQALEKGMYQVQSPSPEVLQEIETIKADSGSSGLYHRLLQEDPGVEGKIHPNDHYRVERALQLVLTEGMPLEKIQERSRSFVPTYLKGFRKLKVGLWLEREELRLVIRKRTQLMLEAGLVAEARQLMEQAGPQWGPLSSIGYAEALGFLRGEIEEKDLLYQIEKNTMALAKRQMTWFKRDAEIRWFHAVREWQEAKEYIYKQTRPT